jgi:hypothetical protein
MLEFIFALSAALLFVSYAVFKWRNRRHLSKDDAEEVLRRRFREGRVIGARFIRENKAPIWEFEILEGGRIHRVQIGAMTGTILNEKYSPARQSFGPNVGKRILP